MITEELKTRLLRGFTFFWDLKPSKFEKKHVIYLHEWMRLLKSAAGKTESQPLDNDDLYEIGKEIFS